MPWDLFLISGSSPTSDDTSLYENFVADCFLEYGVINLCRYEDIFNLLFEK